MLCLIWYVCHPVPCTGCILKHSCASLIVAVKQRAVCPQLSRSTCYLPPDRCLATLVWIFVFILQDLFDMLKSIKYSIIPKLNWNDRLFMGLCLILSLCFCLFLAPDQNPTGVQGFGTEHNNLVISWKVINMYLYNQICLIQQDNEFSMMTRLGSLHPAYPTFSCHSRCLASSPTVQGFTTKSCGGRRTSTASGPP